MQSAVFILASGVEGKLKIDPKVKVRSIQFHMAGAKEIMLHAILLGD